MKNNRVVLMLIGGVAALGGIYYGWSYLRRKKLEKNQGIITDTNTTTPDGKPDETKDGYTKLLDGMTQGIAKAVKNITSGYMKYAVNTKETKLNVRQKADGNSKIVGKLNKDSVILARSSNVVGWMEVSNDGGKPIGFVSTAFLRYVG